MDVLPKISKPADGALHEAGLRTLKQLARWSEAEVAALHGVGPSAIKRLREALSEKGLHFRGARAEGSPAVASTKVPAPAKEAPAAARTRSSSGLRRYAALLRGVSPMNAKMPEIKRCFEAAGFEDVRTVLSSGNVLFSAPEGPEAQLERQAEAAMEQGLARGFPVIVRSVEALQELLAADPYQAFELAPGSKRVVTFLRQPPKARPTLPLELEGARILTVRGREVFTAYIPGDTGPAFMRLIEATFTKDVTTRTWDTVGKLAR